MIIIIFPVAFNLIEYKVNIIVLLTEIPAMLLTILTVTHLAFINTVDKSVAMKLLYFSTAALLILIQRLLYQGYIYDIADERNDILLKYDSRIFFKITYWIYLLFFLIFVFGVFNGANRITDFCLGTVSWALNLKLIGEIIPWVAGLMVIGSIKMILFGSLSFIFRRKSQ